MGFWGQGYSDARVGIPGLGCQGWNARVGMFGANLPVWILIRNWH